MDIKVNTRDGIDYASVAGDRELIFDGQTALDLIMTVRYETGCDRVAIGKEAFSETFFTLSSGLAGEVLQKFINYRMRLAIVGDFHGTPACR